MYNDLNNKCNAFYNLKKDNIKGINMLPIICLSLSPSAAPQSDACICCWPKTLNPYFPSPDMSSCQQWTKAKSRAQR